MLGNIIESQNGDNAKYVETLRAWKEASDEMKREQREKAIAIIKQSDDRQLL